ncbi:MAG: hypothetical protein MMC33_008115 [Icmadophila ericetorum]|nr:hypothetical protein [Icmadophila ericetorum]
MNKGSGSSEPALRATFYPGGDDDYYVPEVISPAPQRSMQEVPGQLHEGLAHLELDGNQPNRFASPASLDRGPVHPSHAGSDAAYNQPPLRTESAPAFISEEPTFSPFPKVHNRPPNVPPSDEEKETILENARLAVLNSNDPEMQLTWAQDALAFVDVAFQNERRIAENQPPRANTPRIEHQLRVDAVNVASFLADQHHPKAEFMRAKWLEFGKFGFRMDLKEAFRAYSRAAQSGYPRAEYRMGMQFESSQDLPGAIKHYKLGVQARDAASHYRLGMMTLLGQHGQRQDFAQGIELLKFSADYADEDAPQGAYVFGMIQARGLPQVTVPEQYLALDIPLARYNIEKAAYLGFAKAQAKMGLAYELGQLGCNFDPVLSLHYCHLASRQGEPEAEMAISKWFLSGYEGVFSKNEEIAYNYAQRAAQSGLATAEFAMGYFLEVGIYVPSNLKEARVWYSKAAEHGNKDAASRIEGISRSKTLSRKDHEKITLAKIQSQRRTSAFPESPTTPNQYINMPDAGQAYENYGNLAKPPASKPYGVSVYPSQAGRGNPGYPPNPNFRPIPAGTPPVDNRHRPPQVVPPGYQQPYPNSDSRFNDGRGRISPGQRIDPNNLNPQQYRHASTTSLPGSIVPPNADAFRRPLPAPGLPASPAPPNSQYYRQPSPSRHQQQAGPTPPKPQHSQPNPDSLPAFPSPNEAQKPLPNIGFVAPQDPSGADRKRRVLKTDNPGPPPNMQHGRPTPSQNYDPRQERKPVRPQGAQTAQSYGPDSRPAYTGSRTDSPASITRPLRQESLPVKPVQPSPVPSLGLSPGPSNPSNNNQTPYNKPNAGGSTTNHGGKKPGKGPSTFDQMNIPLAKEESDCIVM